LRKHWDEHNQQPYLASFREKRMDYVKKDIEVECSGCLYVLSAGAVHERGRLGRAGRWETKVRGRTHGLFLLVARIHGGGMSVGNTRGGRDRRRYPRGVFS
jgi:hypothetical protein